LARKRDIRSDLGWSTSDQVVVRGKSLPDEILGHMSLGTFTFFELTGETPTAAQARVFDAIVIALVEHGLTPSALVARMTYAGAPESLQSAVAAGLSGLGTVFAGTMEGASRLLYEALEARREDAPLEDVARDTVASLIEARAIVPGLGHPVHKPVDPRAVRLFEIAEENGMAGDYVRLMQLIGAEAERASGKVLPVNATGAIGAICCELGFPWEMVRGIAVMARAIGLVAHISEEIDRPMALEVWRRAEQEGSAHLRPPDA
jgi:citrate synthase